MNILNGFEKLLPLAVSWAQEQEAHILKHGVPLSDEEKRDAQKIGVQEIERVRLLRVEAIPFPQDEILGKVAREIGFSSPHTQGMALSYGIFIRDDAWRNRKIIAHELVHTAQYERRGFDEFLRAYLWQCLTVGYSNSELEREAIEVAARVLDCQNHV